MIRLNGFVQKQAQLILDNHQYATICAVLLALLPYIGWLSIAIIALVTLRKGWQQGFNLLLPVLVIQFAISLISMPWLAALINALIVFIPSYMAACALRATASWRAVASLFFALILGVIIVLHVALPGFIKTQFILLQSLINDLQSDSMLAVFLNGSKGLNQEALANYLLGIQAMSMVLSAVFPLTLARSIQSRLFYPGEFQKEMLSFRGNKIGLFILVLLIIGAFRENALAINMLPLMGIYFVLAGLSLSANGLISRKTRCVGMIVFLPIMLLPFVMLPVYAILGSLDTLFDFRVYFAEA